MMKRIVIFLLRTYKKIVSPIVSKCGIHCRFYPSCSDYMMQAIERYGVAKGVLLGIKRILRCNPFSKGGYDPLK